MQSASSIDYKSLYEQKSQAYDTLQITVTGLQQQLAQLQKMIFGSRHERFIPANSNPSQLQFDIEAQQVAQCSLIDAKRSATPKR